MINEKYKKFKEILLVRYSFQDYKGSSRLVFLEGGTDYRFFNKLKCEDIDFRPINDYIKSLGIINEDEKDFKKGNCSKSVNNDQNYKRDIKRLFGDDDIRVVLMIVNNDFVGIVDKDNENEYPDEEYRRIISNDTSDLETMLLRGDEGLVELISIMSKDNEVFSRAKYMVYQTNLLINILKNKKLRYQRVEYKDVFKYFKDYNLVVKNYLTFVDNIQRTNTSEYLLEINNEFTQQKLEYNEFIEKQSVDFWKTINGHDLLQMILYLNLNNESFEDLYGFRQFEYFLIDNYNYKKFKNEVLYKKMKNFKLIN